VVNSHQQSAGPRPAPSVRKKQPQPLRSSAPKALSSDTATRSPGHRGARATPQHRLRNVLVALIRKEMKNSSSMLVATRATTIVPSKTAEPRGVSSPRHKENGPRQAR